VNKLTNDDPCMQKRVGVEASEASYRRTPMPKYVIQREYLLPVYQYLVIEADTFEEACAEVVGPEHDWDNPEEDYDGSLPTTITNAKRSRRQPQRIITSSRAVHCNSA